MNQDQLILIAKRAAEAHQIDPALVCAVCAHESKWNFWAVRYEPAFYDRYVKSMVLRETEKQTRATSFGLMQIMGQVARELGFGRDYLTELLDPETNVEYGCQKLHHCLDRTAGDVNKALLLYNGGGSPEYPSLVLAHINNYR